MTTPTPRLEDRVAALEGTVGIDPDGVTLRDRVVWLQQMVSEASRLENATTALGRSTDDLTTVLVRVDQNAVALRDLDAKQNKVATELDAAKKEIVPKQIIETQRRNDRFVVALIALVLVLSAASLVGFLISNRNTINRINDQRRQSLSNAYINCWNSNAQLDNQRTLLGQVGTGAPTAIGTAIEDFLSKIPPDANCGLYATQIRQLGGVVPSTP